MRTRIKMYKALLGPEAAVYGDHVELSEMTRERDEWVEHGRDFASTIGVGGVVGTKFIWPDLGERFSRVFLDPDKAAHWRKWMAVQDRMRLSSGTFRSLYVHGFDLPEAYAIEKDGKMHYAFFAADASTVWSGTVELRGLAPGRYRIVDYVDGRGLGFVDAARAHIAVTFTGHLLVEASPSGKP